MIHGLDSAEDRSIRGVLKQLIAQDPDVIRTVEAIVHPLVAAHRTRFLSEQDAPIVVFDIPLLFETGADAWLDSVLVVSVPSNIQKERVMARNEMDEDMFARILSRQMPDAEKREKADHVIETLTLDGTRAAVRELISTLKEG